MYKEITKRLIGPDNSMGRLSEITEDILSTLTEDEIKLVNLFKSSLNDLSTETLLEKLKSSTDQDEKLLILTAIVDKSEIDSVELNDSPDIVELRNLAKQDEYKNLLLEVYNLTNGVEDKDDFLA